ncbi:DUF7577 domain-containing protein [Natrarchaeobius chitinivorans]|uniref:DUF7577 domain-containing protein n=1 Tax=Natrarchaeobius chitinivorans TaxID=1679083 RepID=A0A3N6LQF7_NATCH|nr:hypothetical protein [Natrarchaeobius chitinivorans]RQG90497.1 hypothetical protein EA473_20930 [Natrarchaeobius chitinivorans]
MELWGWLIGYVVLFALLHLVLYYVYARREDGESSSSPSFADPDRGRTYPRSGTDRYPRPPDGTDDVEDPEEDHEIDGESVRCPHCGAHNAADQTFTYCWRCVSTLRH